MKRLVWLVILMGSAVLAADRHVYLDTDGDGQLNDCPNPAHNADASAGDTSELEECTGGTQANKIIGTATGRTTSGNCTGGGGVVEALNNADTADVDGDATVETVYGHPQACVWNMAPSDDCDVHAGTYTRAGAQCQESCGDVSKLMNNAADHTPSKTESNGFDTWFSSIVALGLGPNLSSNGYGTAADKAYIRGANSNGSIDSWDSDGDKIPDTEAGEPTSYPAILSGDRDNDGAFDQTTDPGTMVGDSFFAVFVGCIQIANVTSNGGSHISGMCGEGLAADEDGIEIDTDANGTFDTEIHQLVTAYSGIKPTQHLAIKDLEFTRYNGGNDEPGTRIFNYHGVVGRFNLIGNGNDPGHVVDHIYLHDNDSNYSNLRACITASCDSAKAMWAEFGDDLNHYCAHSTLGEANGHTEISDSLIHWSTTRLVSNQNATDHGLSSAAGCPLRFHDNRVVMDHEHNPARIDGGDNQHSAWAFYFKHLDETGDNAPATPKKMRIYNNEFIIQNIAGDVGNERFFNLQAIGYADEQGVGEIWFYGNLVRDHSTVTSSMNDFMPYWCTVPNDSNGNLDFYLFNNTFDIAGVDMDYVCRPNSWSYSPNIFRSRNNAFWDIDDVCEETNGVDGSAGWESTSYFKNCVVDETRCTGSQLNQCATKVKANWFDDVVTTRTYYNALTLYDPQPSGDLDETGSCDPDGDGTAGVDYDGDGSNDNTWTDIAGNTVACPTLGTTLDIGAIQSGTDAGGDICNNNIKEGAEACDGSDLGGATCETQGFSCGTLSCNVGCTAFVTTSCVAIASCGNAAIDTVGTCNEICDGAVFGGATCENQGFGNCGVLACAGNCLSYVTTGCNTDCTRIIGGVTLNGVTVN